MSLGMTQKTVVKVQQEFSDDSEIELGVRQGCCMSPLLFNIYTAMMLETMEGVEEGVRIGVKLFKDVRFADDQGMVAGREAGLQKIMNSPHFTATKYGMKLNIKKTKVMRVSRDAGKVNIMNNGTKIEQVKSFKYLQ